MLVRVRCRMALEASVSALDASAFEPAFCSTLGPAGVLPLDRDFARREEGDFSESLEEEPPCDAVLLGARGLDTTIVFWQKAEDTIAEKDFDDGLDPFAVYLEPAGDSLYLAGSGAMHVRTLEGPVPEVDCSSLEKPEGLP